MWPRPGSTTDAWSVTSTRSFSPRDGCPERRGAPRQAVRWPAVEPCPGARPGPTAVVRSAVEHRARRCGGSSRRGSARGTSSPSTLVRSAVEHRARRCGGSSRRGSARGSSWPPTFARSAVEHRARRCGTGPGRPVLSRRRLVGRPLLREGKNLTACHKDSCSLVSPPASRRSRRGCPSRSTSSSGPLWPCVVGWTRVMLPTQAAASGGCRRAC